MSTGRATIRGAMSETAQLILAMERAALNRWAKGDPDGFLEICDDAVVYFDPFQERRLDGIAELKALYEGLRGAVHLDQYELIDPSVRIVGDCALLTFNFVSRTGDAVQRWNTTELYERRECGWKIVHSHWSFTKP